MLPKDLRGIKMLYLLNVIVSSWVPA